VGATVRRKHTVEEFWSLIDKNGPIPPRHPELGPCWLWMGTRDSQGYGCFTLNGLYRTHRIARVLTSGPLTTENPWVLHRCDNPPCCNPAHLFDGTDITNAADRDAKRRHQHGSTHYAAKITERQAAEFMSLYYIARVEIKEIAAEYGCSPDIVYSVVNGHTWSHVTGLRFSRDAQPLRKQRKRGKVIRAA
jgi:predicted DNA-binding protein YlxM (UPF0122 family)